MLEDRHKTKDEMDAEKQIDWACIITLIAMAAGAILEYFHMNPIYY